MSDLILNCSADNRHDCRPHVSFTGFAFYISVHCGFDKYLNLKSCLNAHNHNTCRYVCPKQVVLREKWDSSLLILVKLAKHKYLPLLPW